MRPQSWLPKAVTFDGRARAQQWTREENMGRQSLEQSGIVEGETQLAQLRLPG
jgi:hypothetical protein